MGDKKVKPMNHNENTNTRINRNSDELVISRYNVEWKIFDITGEVSRDSMPFETKEQADRYVAMLRKKTPKNLNLDVIVRELSTNEIVDKMRKEQGKKNFKRAKR